MSLLGLENIPPEIAKALEPVLLQLETRVDQIMKESLARVDTMVQSALDRLDGAQVVAAITVKLPQDGAKIPEIAHDP